MAKIKLKILGKTVKLKPHLSGSDKNISFIEMNNIHQFYITNKTNAFMKVQKVAFYYQKQIYTLNTQLELSPLAGKTLNLENFEYGFNNGKGFVFKNMTAMKAKKQNIFLGFAISYEINGRNNTFFKKINKSLYHFNEIN
ncbi:MAG: hypothetical protein JKY80_06995 [Mariprofundaceae bacterium]|nr:hypothetical protein [Mariprofundaceae bacterium]